MGRLIG